MGKKDSKKTNDAKTQAKKERKQLKQEKTDKKRMKKQVGGDGKEQDIESILAEFALKEKQRTTVTV